MYSEDFELPAAYDRRYFDNNEWLLVAFLYA